MYNNQFYNQFFNQEYVTPNYYSQIQDQIAKHEYEQSQEVSKVVKAVHDLCVAYQKLDNDHQQQAFYLALAEMAAMSGWNTK